MSSGRWGARAEPPSERGTMADGTAAFLVAVGGTSVVCYWLMNRVQNRGARRTSGDISDSGGYDSGSSSWSVTRWFSSDNSSSSDSSGSSGSSGSWDSGGSDSGGGGGGDSGGGGD